MITSTATFPVAPASSVPTVPAVAMAKADVLAVEEFGIDLLQMMEQAGSHLAELARAELGGDLRGRRVVVAVGPGNNGGGGLAAARHLVNRGAAVLVILAQPVSRLSAAGRHQIATLLQMSVDCWVAVHDAGVDEVDRAIAAADLVVDAILGYGGAGPPRDGVRWLMERVARAPAVISLDLPSGVDADDGTGTDGPTIAATATLTLALPKPGLFAGVGRERAGRVFLADIGLPAALFQRLGVDAGMPFATGPIVQLEAER